MNLEEDLNALSYKYDFSISLKKYENKEYFFSIYEDGMKEGELSLNFVGEVLFAEEGPNINVYGLFLKKERTGLGTRILKTLKDFGEQKNYGNIVLMNIMSMSDTSNLTRKDRYEIFMHIADNIKVKYLAPWEDDEESNTHYIIYKMRE